MQNKQIKPTLILSTIIYCLWDWLIDSTYLCDKQILKNHPKRKLYNNIASKYTTILIQNFRKECVLHMQQNLGQAQTKTEQKIVSIYFVKKKQEPLNLWLKLQKSFSLFLFYSNTQLQLPFRGKRQFAKKEKKIVVSVVSLHVFTSIILFRLATFN